MTDEICGETTVFWPDDECMDVGPCIKPKGHDGEHKEADTKAWMSGRWIKYEGHTWGEDD